MLSFFIFSLSASCHFYKANRTFLMVFSLGLSIKQSWWKLRFTFSTSYFCNSRCLIALSKCYLQECCLSGILRLLFCKKVLLFLVISEAKPRAQSGRAGFSLYLNRKRIGSLVSPAMKWDFSLRPPFKNITTLLWNAVCQLYFGALHSFNISSMRVLKFH